MHLLATYILTYLVTNIQTYVPTYLITLLTYLLIIIINTIIDLFGEGVSFAPIEWSYCMVPPPLSVIIAIFRIWQIYENRQHLMIYCENQ